MSSQAVAAAFITSAVVTVASAVALAGMFYVGSGDDDKFPRQQQSQQLQQPNPSIQRPKQPQTSSPQLKQPPISSSHIQPKSQLQKPQQTPLLSSPLLSLSLQQPSQSLSPLSQTGQQHLQDAAVLHIKAAALRFLPAYDPANPSVAPIYESPPTNLVPSQLVHLSIVLNNILSDYVVYLLDADPGAVIEMPLDGLRGIVDQLGKLCASLQDTPRVKKHVVDFYRNARDGLAEYTRGLLGGSISLARLYDDYRDVVHVAVLKTLDETPTTTAGEPKAEIEALLDVYFREPKMLDILPAHYTMPDLDEDSLRRIAKRLVRDVVDLFCQYHRAHGYGTGSAAFVSAVKARICKLYGYMDGPMRHRVNPLVKRFMVSLMNVLDEMPASGRRQQTSVTLERRLDAAFSEVHP